VSVTVPPAIHADIVIGCARAGVDAIHCEKPMALTWGGAREMATECWRRDVRLTFNHQRRFGQPFRDTQAMIEDGEIGDLQRVVFMWGNLYDQGTHAIDMCNKFNGETPDEWILAGLDYRDEDVRFGTHNENQIVGHWRYENGVHGLAATDRGEDLYPGTWYVEGTDGAISVDLPDYAVDVRRAGETDWTRTSYEREDLVTLAVEDVVSAYREGRASELRAENALNATEIIFGGYESVRRRGRVDFPLEIDDNPLEEMVESGALTPEPADDAE
jgi:predicted dehydrogenase